MSQQATPIKDFVFKFAQGAWQLDKELSCVSPMTI